MSSLLYTFLPKLEFYQNRRKAAFFIYYSNRLYPLLLECYILKETFVAAFAGPFYKIYDINGEFFGKVSFIDLPVNIEQ